MIYVDQRINALEQTEEDGLRMLKNGVIDNEQTDWQQLASPSTITDIETKDFGDDAKEGVCWQLDISVFFVDGDGYRQTDKQTDGLKRSTTPTDLVGIGNYR